MNTEQDQPHTLPAAEPADDPRPTDEYPERPWWRRPLFWLPVGLLLVLAVAYGTDLALAGSDIPRGTTVAGVRVGGLSSADAEQRLDQDVVPELLRPREVTAGSAELTVDPARAGIDLDVTATLAATGEQPWNPITRLMSFFGGDRDVEPVLTVDEAALAAAMTAVAGQVDSEPVEGSIRVEGTTATAVAPVDGQELDQPAAADAVLSAVRADAESVDLPIEARPTEVSAEAVQEALEEFALPALAGPVGLLGPAGNRRAEVPVTAIAAALRFAPGPDGTLVGSVDVAALQTALGDALAPFTVTSRNAGFELSGGRVQIIPAVDGTSADYAALATALTEALPAPVPRDVSVPLTPSPAEVSTEEAQALGITEQVSTFTTNFTNENSGENIRVVAAEVDGAVILPGETFSLNGFTGPRTAAEGYIESTIIDNGEFVQAIGGGISQFATTMFNAVFFAGLEDIYHKPHSYYISRYPEGREATVFYDSIDLSWRNDSETGIYVQTSWEPGAITVTFWGTKHFDIESVTGGRYNYSDYETQRKADDGDCVAQSGSEGFDVDVTRVFRPVGGGAALRQEVFSTTYNPVPTIICVEPGTEDDAGG